MIAPDKNQLRTTLRQRRRSLSPQQQKLAMQAISRFACSLPQWPSAQRIGLYHTADGEIGTEAIAQCCHGQGKKIYLPVIKPDMSMAFAQWRKGDQLLKNRVGIDEPAPEAPRCPTANIDILFVPLVGWDKRGNRLGMGAGYYDRALKEINGPLLIGLAHKIQEVDEIPSDYWDVPLHAIITDAGIHVCQ